MEDETGFINLILYAHVFDRLRHVATTSALLTAHGKIERDGEVVYVVVERLEKLTIQDRAMPSMSRDFHCERPSYATAAHSSAAGALFFFSAVSFIFTLTSRETPDSCIVTP